jgi:hypothetical protein
VGSTPLRNFIALYLVLLGLDGTRMSPLVDTHVCMRDAEYSDDHELLPRIEAYTRFFQNNADDLINLVGRTPRGR